MARTASIVVAALLWLTVAAIKPLTTSSGAAVSRYGLGGAARSTQPATLARSFCERVGEGAFLFFYSPDRYPAFLRGVRDLCHGAAGASAPSREQLFVCAGGAARDAPAMERRLDAALAVANRAHALDCFVLEYVRPDELEGAALRAALARARAWQADGRVRYVGASTHSHGAGAALAPLVDVLFVRYSCAHAAAAEARSLPAAAASATPVVAFTTTRWNALLGGHPRWAPRAPPSAGECLAWALGDARGAVRHVLHSARDEAELAAALDGLEARHPLGAAERARWREYGELDWDDDGFVEFDE